MTPAYSSPFQHNTRCLFVSPDVSQCLPSTPNDSNSPSLLPNYTPKSAVQGDSVRYIVAKIWGAGGGGGRHRQRVL